MPEQGAEKQRWTNKERDALCERLADDFVNKNIPIDGSAVRALAALEGQPWRRREKDLTPSYYKKAFLGTYREKIEELVSVKRQEAEAKRQAAQTAVAQAEAQQAAQPPSLPTPLPEVPFPDRIEQPTMRNDMTLGQIVDAVMAQQIETALTNQAQQITMGLQQVLSEAFKSLPGFNNFAFAPPPERDRKRTVLLAHADAKQLESVQREFPFLDVVAMGRDIPEDVQPDLVVGINLFGSDGLDKKLRKRFGRDYAPAFGGADGAKRVISARLVDPRLVPKNQQLSHHH